MIISAFKKDQDPQWIGLLYERYSGMVLAVACKYLKPIQEAEDMAMDLFLRLPELLLKHEVRRFRPWLHRTVRNTCLMRLRSEKSRGHKVPLAEGRIEEVDDGGRVEAIRFEEEWEAIEHWMDELTIDQRRCVEAFYLKECSYQQIAKDFDIPLKTVKSHLQNGRRRLQLFAKTYRDSHGRA